VLRSIRLERAFELEAPRGGIDAQLTSVWRSRSWTRRASAACPRRSSSRTSSLSSPLVSTILGEEPAKRRGCLVELTPLFTHTREKQLQVDPRLAEAFTAPRPTSPRTDRRASTRRRRGALASLYQTPRDRTCLASVMRCSNASASIQIGASAVGPLSRPSPTRRFFIGSLPDLANASCREEIAKCRSPRCASNVDGPGLRLVLARGATPRDQKLTAERAGTVFGVFADRPVLDEDGKTGEGVDP